MLLLTSRKEQLNVTNKPATGYRVDFIYLPYSIDAVSVNVNHELWKYPDLECVCVARTEQNRGAKSG